MTRYRFEDVVPHASPMALMDFVEHWDDSSLESSVLIRPDAPFAEEMGVPSWVGIEYMAQTIGAFAGVHARQKSEPVKIGFLVGCRRYTCSHSWFPLGSSLRVTVKQEIMGENGLSVFECRINGDDNIEAHANLNVFQPDDPDSFLGDSTL